MHPDLPPACPAAEAALLGAVLLTPQRAAELLDGLGAEHVSTPAHTVVLEAMTGLLAAGVLPEPVAVLERLQRTGQARAPVFAGRAAGVVLADLMEAVTIPSAAPYWRDLVVEYAARRRLLAVASRVEQAAHHAESDTLADVVVDARREFGHHLQQHPGQARGHAADVADVADVAAVAGIAEGGAAAEAAGAASDAGQVGDRRYDRGAWEAA